MNCFRDLAILGLLAALLAPAGCSDEGGPSDSGTDTGHDSATDPCTTYPGTCNMDPRIPRAPWDCCPDGQACCPLCDGPDSCNLDYECRTSCPEVLPCTGTAGTGGFSCWYDPEDLAGGTAYCAVPDPLPASGTVECAATCSTGIECPFSGATYGNAALCCPTGTACGASGFGLPFCQ